MPSRPKSICRYPGCGRLIDSGSYCERHQKVEKEQKALFDKRRQSSHERGYSYQWRKARQLFLLESPLCIECEKQGRLTAATVVDHIVPHKGDQFLFWDESNWAPLCTSCHNRKTAREDGGFGNLLKTKV